jgi:hypothetical protein
MSSSMKPCRRVFHRVAMNQVLVVPTSFTAIETHHTDDRARSLRDCALTAAGVARAEHEQALLPTTSRDISV